MTIESLRDTFKAESENSEFSSSLAAMFNAVHKVPTKAFLDHKSSAVPNFRMAEEDELIEKINTAASLIGTEKFYLKIRNILCNKGAFFSNIVKK